MHRWHDPILDAAPSLPKWWDVVNLPSQLQLSAHKFKSHPLFTLHFYVRVDNEGVVLIVCNHILQITCLDINYLQDNSGNTTPKYARVVLLLSCTAAPLTYSLQTLKRIQDLTVQ
jgi:hypothetical protein